MEPPPSPPPDIQPPFPAPAWFRWHFDRNVLLWGLVPLGVNDHSMPPITPVTAGRDYFWELYKGAWRRSPMPDKPVSGCTRRWCPDVQEWWVVPAEDDKKGSGPDASAPTVRVSVPFPAPKGWVWSWFGAVLWWGLEPVGVQGVIDSPSHPAGWDQYNCWDPEQKKWVERALNDRPAARAFPADDGDADEEKSCGTSDEDNDGGRDLQFVPDDHRTVSLRRLLSKSADASYLIHYNDRIDEETVAIRALYYEIEDMRRKSLVCKKIRSLEKQRAMHIRRRTLLERAQKKAREETAAAAYIAKRKTPEDPSAAADAAGAKKAEVDEANGP